MLFLREEAKSCPKNKLNTVWGTPSLQRWADEQNIWIWIWISFSFRWYSAPNNQHHEILCPYVYFKFVPARTDACCFKSRREGGPGIFISDQGGRACLEESANTSESLTSRVEPAFQAEALHILLLLLLFSVSLQVQDCDFPLRQVSACRCLAWKSNESLCSRMRSRHVINKYAICNKREL